MTDDAVIKWVNRSRWLYAPAALALAGPLSDGSASAFGRILVWLLILQFAAGYFAYNAAQRTNELTPVRRLIVLTYFAYLIACILNGALEVLSWV